MRGFVSSLTAAVLFIHTVLGCCWHHAHGCEHELDAASTLVAECCHHEHEGDAPRDQQPCNVHCIGSCNYIVPSKVRVVAPQWVVLEGFTTSDTSLWDLSVLSQACAERNGPLVDFPPPLRLHLLHQLLLN